MATSGDLNDRSNPHNQKTQVPHLVKRYESEIRHGVTWRRGRLGVIMPLPWGGFVGVADSSFRRWSEATDFRKRGPLLSSGWS